ncbi:MAG: hypothetical protein EOM59_04880 [Clostridia bacterium]|nr:hypothetical protein [Clostridia bacterium]
MRLMNRRSFIFLLILFALAMTACSAEDSQNSTNAKPEINDDGGIEITVTEEELQRYATESTTVWEFVQRFFKDKIVYKNRDGKFIYEPVDFSLPLSDYNWDNLVALEKAHKELEYVQDGQTISIKGIDISRYQQDIDWARVAKDGVKYAIIRLGYRGYDKGGLVKDDAFDTNVKGALKNEIPVGVYFVTQAISVEEAIEEAEYVLENMRPYNITWPVVLDIEDAASATARTVNLTQEQRTDFAIAFCETIKEAGYTPMLYCNIRWFIEELDLARLTEYDKWFAQYFTRPFFPYAFEMWQYTSSGRVDGISGNVDLNICFKDYGNLQMIESEE